MTVDWLFWAERSTRKRSAILPKLFGSTKILPLTYYNEKRSMSKSYKVTVFGGHANVERWVTIVDFPESEAKSQPETVLERTAKNASKIAIIKRWQKLSPENRGEPNFIRSFEIEPLLEIDAASLTVSGIGPYITGSGIKVWMTEGPFSFGIAAPRRLGRGGAW